MAITESRTLHFDLAHITCDSPLTFHQSLKDYAVSEHTDASRAAAREEYAFLKLIPDKNLTHFVDVPDISRDQLVLTYITKRKVIGDQEVDAPIHLGVYLPAIGLAHAATWIKANRAPGVVGGVGGVHHALARFGVTPESFAATVGSDADPEFPAHINTLQDATDAAVGLLFHHPTLINLNTDNSSAIPAYIITQHIVPAVQYANDLMDEIFMDGDGYLVTSTYTAADGTQVTSTLPSTDVQQVVAGSLTMAIRTSQADTQLLGQQWNYQYSSTSAPYGGTMQSSPSSPAHSDVIEVALDVAPGGTTWVARNVSQTNGLSIGTPTVTPPPAGDSWYAYGVWSQNDVAPMKPFSAAMLAALQGGTLYLQVAATGTTAFTMSGQLVLGTTPDPTTGLTTVSVTLAPVGTPPATLPTTSVTMTLNSGKTGLTYEITADGLGTSATCGFFTITGGAAPVEVCALPFSNYGDFGTITVDCTNTYLRHLSVYVQYLGVGGKVLAPPTSWVDGLPSWLVDTFQSDPTKKFLSVVSPVTTVFGIPVPATPTTLSIPIWEEVSTVRLLWGGLGCGNYDAGVCPVGIVLTALCELVMPPFMMVAGAAITNSKFVVGLMADKEVLYAVCAAGAFLVSGPTAAYIALSQDPSGAATGLTEKFAPELLSATTSLGKWVAEQIVKGTAEKATPFIDVALAIVNGAATAAELAMTIIDVLDSPFVYETDFVSSVDIVVTLNPDPRFNKFPDYHDHFTVTVSYDVGTTLPTKNFNLPITTQSDPITVTFTAVPAGGMACVQAFFYAANDWQSGQGVSEWVSVVGGTNGDVAIALTITTNEVTLTKSSVYYHVQKLALVDNVLTWQAALDAPPTATIKTTPPPFLKQGQAVMNYCGITMNQQAEMIGLSYQASGLGLPQDFVGSQISNDALFMVENLSLLANPETGTSVPPVAFSGTAGMAYNMAAAQGSTGTSFFLDSSPGKFNATSNPAGGVHARSIVLTPNTPPTFGTNSNSSYGRFPSPLLRYVVHPQGIIFGISLDTHKIFILTLASVPGPDASAPLATLASGQGFRDGLISGPAGIAVALDGRVLILESLNQRIQAFDTRGKPVPYFAGIPSPLNPTPGLVPTMLLRSTPNATYLDLSVESFGYIYVLYYTGDGSQPSDYAVDIYQPNGKFLASTPNVAAANLVVDILRNMWTMNYETILDAHGLPQPSVSQWMPPAPPPPPSGGSV
ncbi:MAG: hypothetical protein V4550_14015 [Gemmatimonadota bacterium]